METYNCIDLTQYVKSAVWDILVTFSVVYFFTSAFVGKFEFQSHQQTHQLLI